jgi:hypothetical protein
MAVKDRLIEILQAPPIQQQLQNMSDDEINEQVFQLLDDVIKENKLPAECQLSTLQIQNLKKRAGERDGRAAYLFGSAVWEGIADPGGNCHHEPILLTPGHDPGDGKTLYLWMILIHLILTLPYRTSMPCCDRVSRARYSQG